MGRRRRRWRKFGGEGKRREGCRGLVWWRWRLAWRKGVDLIGEVRTGEGRTGEGRTGEGRKKLGEQEGEGGSDLRDIR